MGFFVLRKGDARRGPFEGFRETATRHGFQPQHSLSVAGYALDLFGNLTGNDPQLVTFESGDFIASYGLLFYRDACGEAALTSFHRDFDAERFDWDGLSGLATLLVKKDGRLHLIGDGLGSCKIFHDSDFSLLSNSFVALAHLGAASALDRQGCFEYVFAGSCYGRRTLLSGISSLPPNAIAALHAGGCTVIQRPSPISQKSWPEDVDLDRVARHHIERVDSLMAPVVAHYGDRLRLSFSGGYDSRLALASLLKRGARPTLFTYGGAQSLDVRIAREIAEAEGLAFEQIDKSRVATPPPEDLPALLERDLFAFDGWKSDEGLFSNGADHADRLRRHENGQLPINGSLGEIYRNFFYLPDGPLPALDLVSTFYAQYDPACGGPLFDEDAYRARLAETIAEDVAAEDGRLARWQVEAAYPLFRGRYWSGHDGQINQRFGPMLFPYLEHALISDTARIPLKLKDLGLLQGRMIELQNERLAAYPSDYGYALSAPRPLKHRLLYALNCRRPMALRRRAFRLKNRRPEPRPDVLSPAYLSKVIDPDLPHTASLFRTEAMTSASQFNRVATLEYLATRLDLQAPEPTA